MFCIAILYSGNEGQRSYAKLNVQTEVKFAVINSLYLFNALSTHAQTSLRFSGLSKCIGLADGRI